VTTRLEHAAWCVAGYQGLAAPAGDVPRGSRSIEGVSKRCS
jgi:hypothetical protein